jgi:uncharacterized DUF497 family protein
MGGRGGDTSSRPSESSSLRFEWDPAKSVSNKDKHGVDFEEAKAIWRDPDREVIASKYIDETRELTIASLNGKMYTAVSTMRDGVIRIISVRRSRKDEEARYGG